MYHQGGFRLMVLMDTKEMFQLDDVQYEENQQGNILNPLYSKSMV
jgi:hypothetical protein